MTESSESSTVETLPTMTDASSMAGFDYLSIEELIKLFEESESTDPTFDNLYQRANIAHLIAMKSSNKSQIIKYLKESRSNALAVHQLKPDDFNTLKVLCSTTGRLAEESSMLDKIKLGFEFKKYLDKMLDLSQESYEILHMRARFNYQVSTLSTAERLLGRTFGLIPECSLEQATAGFLQAEQIEPGYPENAFYLSKTYMAANKMIEAKEWLQKAANADEDEYEEESAKTIREARALLETEPFRRLL